MEHRRGGGKLALAAALCLLLSGCAGTVEGTGRPARNADPEGELAVSAAFRGADGLALRQGTVRLETEERTEDCALDGAGAAYFAGVPREGTVEVSLLDGEERVVGSTAVTFAPGAVMDASTDGTGAGHVTLREDAGGVALLFVLEAGGRLECSLLLRP